MAVISSHVCTAESHTKNRLTQVATADYKGDLVRNIKPGWIQSIAVAQRNSGMIRLANMRRDIQRDAELMKSELFESINTVWCILYLRGVEHAYY